ncbi:DUF6531 domain-containing protein [Dactylosporangium sp. McL0621]|uniref:DUF6531 domain-containing protein n=1 Tax=Dactylosporangium sp. McL0621 TaxID=3415678 RepID=UPI003CF11DF6
MATSSARPDDLDAFAQRSRNADEELRGHSGRLNSLYADFAARTGWGRLEADSLLAAVHSYVDLNEQDARWVARIAEAFRIAGGGRGPARLPDAAIQASLRAAGLDGGRAAVTFDDPVAYGTPPTTGYADDPVNTASGNFVEVERDLVHGGRDALLTLTRTYNSRSDRTGPFGPGWSSWASVRLASRPDGLEYEGPDGQRALFPRLGDGYDTVAGVAARPRIADDRPVLEWTGGRRWEFGADGRPIRLDEGPGTEVRLTYADGRLTGLTGSGGHTVTLTWEGERIVAAASSDGRAVTYSYDARGALVGVDAPGSSRAYEVDEAGRILSVRDGDGVAQILNVYDAEGRVLQQTSAFGRRSRYAYLPGRVTAVAGEGDDEPADTYVHDRAGRLLNLVDAHEHRFSVTYDPRGNPVTVSERDGSVTVNEWDERSRLVRQVRPGGGSIALRYDDHDRVVEATGATGGRTRLRYDGDERVPWEITDAEGGVTRLRVAGGLVHEVTDPDGVRTRFRFDHNGEVVAITDEDGNTATLERDATGRVTAVVTPEGRRTTLEYDRHGRLTRRRLPSGSTWRYEYTAGGRLAAVVEPTGNRREFTYGPHGHPTATVDGLGRVMTREYGPLGNVTQVTGANGARWELHHDGMSRLVGTVDPTGAAWRWEYDANGNVVAETDPTGVRRTMTVDPAGRPVTVHDGLAAHAYEYDADGRLLVERLADGTRTRAEYDRCGRRVAVANAAGGITRFAYTGGGRLAEVTRPSGRVERYTYDRCGRLESHTDGAGRRTRRRYDADGLLVERVDAAGTAERFTYDAGARLVAATAPGRGTVRYTYDDADRVVAVTDRVAGARRFEYDPAGRLTAAVDANGGRTAYRYDDADRLVGVVDALGGTVVRRYDEAGRLVAETDQLGRTVTLSRDAAGRPSGYADASGHELHCTYDAAGRLDSFAGPGRPPVTVRRDALGRAVEVNEPGLFLHRLRWDHDGRLVERRRDGLAERWTYDADGRRTAMVYPDGSRTRYTYDDGGLVAGLHHPALGALTLERDPAGRLLRVTGDRLRQWWHYRDGDLVGHRVETDGVVRLTELLRDPDGRVVASTTDGVTLRFGYDPAGQLISAGDATYAYDANGRLELERGPATEVRYRYDPAGQLLARLEAGAETTYAYDAAGRRTLERTGEWSRAYDWDAAGRLTGVRDSGGATVPVTVDALGELAEVGGVALLWDSADPLAPLSFVGDVAVVGLGTPWALATPTDALRLRPDWQGTVGGPRDAWGAGAEPTPAPQVGPWGEIEFGGLVWLRHRVYQPGTRAFLQPDPLDPVAGTAVAGNPYHYAGNSPLALADPLGLRPVTDDELRQYRDRMGRNLWDRTDDWIDDNWEYVAGGAMVLTGVGTPVGMALMSADSNVIIQKAFTGDVNLWMAGAAGATGALGGFAKRVTVALGSGANVAGTVVQDVLAGAPVRPGDLAVSGFTGAVGDAVALPIRTEAMSSVSQVTNAINPGVDVSGAFAALPQLRERWWSVRNAPAC